MTKPPFDAGTGRGGSLPPAEEAPMYHDATAVILAAGKATRFASDGKPIPKALRALRGRPIIDYMLDALGFLPPERIIVVVGFEKEQVMSALRGRCRFAVQEEQLGTGHAAACAAPLLSGGSTFVLYGDMPLLRRATFQALLDTHVRERNAGTMLTGTIPGEQRLGRVLRAPDGSFDRVVEHKDANEAQRAITEYNAGYCFQTEALLSAFPRLRNANAAGEYYLTDIPVVLKGDGGRIGIYYTANPGEIAGADSPELLSAMEGYLDG
jgi:bifunctional N-acetylglucosamine-1-phosphate-uridyltransferase/glucosamine-1-phosphate-acetyltransferase GlmU-like protein